jgi:hypothetical protein
MTSLMTQTAATWTPVALPAASSPVSRPGLVPTFAGFGGEVRPQAPTQVSTQVSTVGRAPEMSGVRASGLPGYPSALAQAYLPAIDVPATVAPTTSAPTTTSVPTTTVRNDKHDPGPSVLRPPV